MALAWVRGEVGLAQVARAFGLPVTSTSEIYGRLSQGLNAWVLQEERNNVTGSDAQPPIQKCSGRD